MNKFSSYLLTAMIGLAVISFPSCSKDEPVAEQDQEEVGKTTILLQEVEWEGDFRTGHAHEVAGAAIDTIEFDEKGNAPVGFHLHVHTGTSYKMTLIARDYAGREIQQTFQDRADIHQAILLGAPAGVLDYTYADNQVGVDGYLHVVSTASTFTLQYIMRHLNPGVKSGVTADDWNNTEYQRDLAGATDLDLKFEIHPVE
jgi:hypothetical protein